MSRNEVVRAVRGRGLNRFVLVGVLIVFFAGSVVLLSAVFSIWSMSRYGARDAAANTQLRELPSAEEYAARVKELFTVNSIPTVRLTVPDDASWEKDAYRDMNMSIVDAENPQNNYLDLGGQIKPRGNSTYAIGLEYGPIPFTIKLDEAANLMGMGDGRKWCLIANFIDRSYVKQFIAFQVAKLIMGEGYFQPEAKFVDVYLNGEYRGLYLLTEPVDESAGRLDLERPDEGISFLLEADSKISMCRMGEREQIEKVFSTNRFFADSREVVPRWLFDDDPLNDNCSFTPYDLKYPDGFKKIDAEQQRYIRDTMYDLYESVKNGLPFDELPIDVDSFVNYWVFTEWFAHATYMESSTFLYKNPSSEKIYYGPLWDFDLDLLKNGTGGFAYYGLNTLSYGLFKYEHFRKLVREQYVEYSRTLFPSILDGIIMLKNNQILKEAVLRAEGKYGTWTRRIDAHIGSPTWDIDNMDQNILTLKSYEEHVSFILGWLYDGYVSINGVAHIGRTRWLNQHLGEWGITDERRSKTIGLPLPPDLIVPRSE